jgi:expansin (peptidoglycan-binding protein)
MNNQKQEFEKKKYETDYKQVMEKIRNILIFGIRSIIKIQSWFRGCIFRLKRLPLILYKIQKYLEKIPIEFSNISMDGRVNSIMDETYIIERLTIAFGTRIKSPSIRMWYDILVFDHHFGWLPVNIKTSTTTSSDNTGNLAMCVYAYTDQNLDLSKTYRNGSMSSLLMEKLRQQKYNNISKKDYYFIVMNKNKPCDIIINSVKGLGILTPNMNNLPFQVKWSKNREFKYEKIHGRVQLFIDCIKKPKPSWKEAFLIDMRNLS